MSIKKNADQRILYAICFNFQISQNVLFNWKSLGSRRRVRPIVYYLPSDLTGLETPNGTLSNDVPDDRTSATKTILDMARMIGWDVLQVPRILKHHLPVFKDMFVDAAMKVPDCTFYAYANGDILFTDSLMDTLIAVDEVISLYIFTERRKL